MDMDTRQKKGDCLTKLRIGSSAQQDLKKK